ncbi:MAG: hypothetical protein QG622_2424 [Actinomycetota bacterium]|nr:hypothetical protein [Actinomycetota bacterium]
MTGQPPAPARIADYDVVETLPRQGSETYLLARPPARLGLLTDRVVIKVMDGRHEVDRFHRIAEELRRFAFVGSQHLVMLYDAGSDDGHLWYSMEHRPMGTLAEPVGQLTPQQCLSAVADAARGAHALHEAGIAHRDIRPGTVLLGASHAALADPDLTRFLSHGQTVTSAAPVSDLEYLDPALIRGETPGRPSDVWALGLTLHRTLTGLSAYPEISPEAGTLPAVRRILSGGPEISTHLDTAVAEVIRSCVAPDPSDRPSTALALAEEIEAL